jgi:hypothetical protein
MTLQLLALSLACGFAAAAAANDSTPVVPDFSHTFRKSTIELRPPANHHFNTKAPNRLDTDGVEIPIKAKKQKITAKVPAKLFGEEVTATTYLCDDAKSYCVKKAQKLQLSPEKPTVKPAP